MAKLNQIIALVNGTKARTQKAITEVYHKLQKKELVTGISRKYSPTDEGGEELPSEQKLVQYQVSTALKESSDALIKLFDLVATQDFTNCEAKANIVIGDEIVVHGCPVTTMLFLEKQLVEFHTMLSKLPTLDPGEDWEWSDEAACWATKSQTTRTKKLPKAFVKYEATPEHPAQVDMFTEDIVIGLWDTTKFSGAINESTRRSLLERCEEIQDALKVAREEANSMEVTNVEIGKNIFEYILVVL